MAALSFSGKRKVIRINASSATSLDAALKSTLQDAPGDNFVVFTSGDLTPASSLRKFFETAEHVAAIPCYNDDNAGQRRLLQTLLAEKGLRFSPQVVDMLQERLPVDRKQVRAEIEKLQLYLGDSLEISPEDVQAVVSQSQESSMDEVAKAIASLDQSNIEAHVQQLLREGVMPIVLLRSVIRYFTRLHYAKGGMTGGASEADVLKGLRPPVFFKDVPLFKRHLSLWSITALDAALQSLEKVERECKKAAMPVEVLCSQLFTLLPLYARQSR
jgi:DNA polymerase-3 subunit delta